MVCQSVPKFAEVCCSIVCILCVVTLRRETKASTSIDGKSVREAARGALFQARVGAGLLPCKVWL